MGRRSYLRTIAGMGRGSTPLLLPPHLPAWGLPFAPPAEPVSGQRPGDSNPAEPAPKRGFERGPISPGEKMEAVVDVAARLAQRSPRRTSSSEPFRLENPLSPTSPRVPAMPADSAVVAVQPIEPARLESQILHPLSVVNDSERPASTVLPAPAPPLVSPNSVAETILPPPRTETVAVNTRKGQVEIEFVRAETKERMLESAPPAKSSDSLTSGAGGSARAAEVTPRGPDPVRPIAAPLAAPRPASLFPPPPAATPPGGGIHIGKIDVHIAPPALPPKPAPRGTTPVTALSRGFTAPFGLRQG